ncbi:hypothetical protein K4F52_001561 [Lecanicillium sp. MT-2017a]|nr:hypothetical protein K4F52_001561 [Lecanicillium sp. MT-2017a]
MPRRMPFDDVAWEESERIEEEWCKAIVQETTLRAIGDFIVKHRGGGVPTELSILKNGGFNAHFRLEFQDGGSAVIRFPKPGATMFPEEKMRAEIAVMRLIQEKTTVPVPFILHWGSREESPMQLGPFIIMEYVPHETTIGQALNMPELGPLCPPILDPNVDITKLETLHRQLADILLQLSKLEFPTIGSLRQTDECSWDATRRPLSIHMNELVRVGSLPRSKLPSSTATSSSAYFQSLARLHMEHLKHQRNDAVESRDDCIRKYLARRIFQNLADEKRLTSPAHENGPFKIWCDDLRPANVLVGTELQISAVLDWEFTYAAPAEFSFAPPWWLLLRQPEYWPAGLEDWERVYDGRLETFLKVMREAEDTAIVSGLLAEGQRLSDKMRQSWQSGDFWVVYAARKSFAFDDIFWRKVYPRFFGPGTPEEGVLRKQAGILSEQDEKDLETFVSKKMEETQTRELIWEPDEVGVVV